MISFTKRHLLRCYPAGRRIMSDNYDPSPAWSIGAQMVALNFQANDMPTWINRGKFSANGGSGYILKPKHLLDPSAPKPSASKPSASKPSSGGGMSAVKPMSFKTAVAAGSAMKSAASKPTPKPAAAKSSAPSFGAGIKAGSMLKKEEFSEFDLILSHLIEQGFGDDEALKLMVNMTEEKRQEILQLDELSKKTMGSYVKKAAKDVEKRSYDQGSTDAEDAEIGPPGQTPKDKKIGKRQKGIGKAVDKMTRKEEDESLYHAYLSMMSEEGCDARKDKEQERNGTDARTDYSKPPAKTNTFGKKKPMSDEERSAAMAKIVAKLKKEGGK